MVGHGTNTGGLEPQVRGTQTGQHGGEDSRLRRKGLGVREVQSHLNCAAQGQLVGQAGTLDVSDRCGQVHTGSSGVLRVTATCWESHNRCVRQELNVGPRIPTCPALPGASDQGRGAASCLPQGAWLSGAVRCGMKGSRLLVRLSGAFFILVLGGALRQTSGGSEAAVRHRQPGWPVTATGALTSVPGAGQAGQRSLALGSECQHQTQLMFAVCWVDSRYPEGRDSTQEVKAETEPLREGSQCRWRKQHAPGTALWKGTRWSAQALVQVGRGEECIDSQTHSQEAPDQGGTDTS